MRGEDILKSYKEGKLTTRELQSRMKELKNQSTSRKPLSEGQKGLWMLEKIAPDMTAYHIPICFRIREELHVESFEKALQECFSYFPILKTVIEEENHIPYQHLDSSMTLSLHKEDLSKLAEEEMIGYIKKIAAQPFSLSRGPLIRAYLFTGDGEQIILINVHHIIFDGVSIEILVHTILDTYLELVQGKEPTGYKEEGSYFDFVEWEQKMLSSQIGEEHRAYWKQQLAGVLPVLELPIDFKRSQASAFKGETYRFQMDSMQKESIITFCKQEQISMSTLFMGIFQVILHQYSNQEELIVGIASMGRPQKQFETMLGYFINMLPIRSKIVEHQSFLQFLKELQYTMLDGMDHADYPFPVMVRDLDLPRNASGFPVFQVGYFYQNFITADSMAKLDNFQNTLSVEFLKEIHQEGEYELTLEVFEQETEIMLHLKYNPDLYHIATIQRMAAHFLNLIQEVLNNPQLSIKEYPMLSKEDEKTILLDWNSTKRDFQSQKCVHEFIEEQARRTPDKIAVVYEEETLTYQELNDKSSQLAVYLQQLGVTPDCLVGIGVERSLFMIIGLLGILKAGGAYVPFDPEYPTERIGYMIENSKVSIVLTQSSLREKMEPLLGEQVKAIVLDTEWERIEQIDIEQEGLKRTVQPHHLAYVLYTSGSTGNPKGVMIPHRALTNFLLSMAEEPGLTEQDTLLAVTTYCFDIAGLELYLPLIMGARCYICSTKKQKNAEILKQEIRRIRPTIMQATPATWTALFLIGWKNEERIKILCGGEAFPERLKQSFMEVDSAVFNMFGPTETTIWSTTKQIKKEELITIGRPIANTQIYILNRHFKPVPMLIPGELYIGGDGLARGYLHLPELTKERFIDNPFCEGTKLYKTGDLARWLPNGEIEFLGRIDNQVKMHGYRIELDEIETRLNEYPAIRESAVVIYEQNENKQLRAFYVCKDEKKVDTKELRSYLKKWLPSYMVPNVFREIAVIPLTPNGKVNRLELSKRDLAPASIEKKESSKTQIETVILEIWKEIIGVEQIGVEDGFFEVGGDSITAVIAVERISQKLACDLKVTSIFEHTNVKELSKYIAQQKELKDQGDMGAVRSSQATDPESALIMQEDMGEDCAEPDYYEDSIAIIGISCQFPNASNYQEFWQNLKAGKESVKRLSKEELKKYGISEDLIDNPNYVPVQSTLEGKDHFDAEFFRISPKDAEAMDPQMRLLLQNSWKAIEDAGYQARQIPNTAVYMSTSNNAYQVSSEPKEVRLIEEADQYVNWLFGQGGTVPTMISYHLGLKGPSYSIHSNCSSSLSGLHAAYQCLRSEEVDYALVGASTIHSLINAGYVHLPGLNFSSDGHIKAFDTTADGMVGGEGVGVLLLKKAKKAIQDKDHIYALLRGIHINNDGADKVGFYAPSIKGQTEVIQKVLNTTRISPETIDYVETHGTGTKLGDPIEFRALDSVYQASTDKKQFCGIGSVKTNIGHLDTASGLAGCIKTALSLYHRQLVPTLNFKEANPEIDFERSPFYVVTKEKDLDYKTTPYRAALSSFGIGGTNGHAIFESYPKNIREKNRENQSLKQSYLIPISAKNEKRLEEYAKLLLDEVNHSFDELDLESLAYTLQTGREAMDSRVLLLVNNKEELVQALTSYLEEKPKKDQVFQRKAGQTESFLLSGQDEDTQELIARWFEKGKLDKIAMLWVQGVWQDWSFLYRKGKLPYRMSLPTYPFAKERYWRGKIPKTIGASDRKEVFLHPLVGRNISDFKEQKYATTLLGDEFFLIDHIINQKKVLPGVTYIEMARAAGEFATKKKIHKIKNIIWAQPVIVEKPCEVEIILTPNGREVEYQVCTSENDQRILRSQGRLETKNESTSTVQMQEPMNISDCISRCNGHISHHEFYEGGNSNVYQYGTTFRPIQEIYCNENEVLARIELPIAREDSFHEFLLHPSLLEGCLQTIAGLLKADHPAFMPFAIDEIEILQPFSKKCYVYATRVNQEAGQNETEKFKMLLLDLEGRLLAIIRNYSIRTISNVIDQAASKTKNLPTLYYRSQWMKTDALQPVKEMAGTTLIFAPKSKERLFSKTGENKYYVIAATQYQTEKNCFEIHPSEQEDYQLLLETLKQKQHYPKQILHMWTFDEAAGNADQAMKYGISSLFYLTKALINVFPKERIQLLIVFSEESGHSLSFHQAMSGFAKTVSVENPLYFVKTVQVSLSTMSSASMEEILKAEAVIKDTNEIRYTRQGRFIKEIKEETMDSQLLQQPTPFRNNGVFLITGGMGGLGLILARYLAKTVKARLVLSGRGALDYQKSAVLLELQALGAQAVYIQADISIRKEAEALLSQTRAYYQEIHGIIHCAGVLQDKLLRNKTYEEMKAVLAPKINGTIFLDEASKAEALDFFVMFSSVSHRGYIGQSDYAYANSFLNAYAQYRETLTAKHERMGKTVSINWPLWKEGGMHMAKDAIEQMQVRTGIYPVTQEAGIQALEVALKQKNSEIMVYYGEADKIRSSMQTVPDDTHFKQSPEKITRNNIIQTDSIREDTKKEYSLKQDTINEGMKEESIAKMMNNDRDKNDYGKAEVSDCEILTKVIDFLIQTVSSLLKIQTVNIDKDMEDYGFDSISNTEFTNRINANYHLDVMPTIFFELEQPTLRALASALCKKYAAQLKVFYPAFNQVTATTNFLSEPVTELMANQTASLTAVTTEYTESYTRFQEQEKGVQETAVIQDKQEKQNKEDMVAIIGMSGIFPQSDNPDEFWENLISEKNLVTEIPADRFNWRNYEDPRVRWGGFMKEVDRFDAPFFGISAQEAKVMDPQHRLFLQTAWSTIEDAGYRPSDLYGSDTGIFVGIGTQDYSRLLDEYLTEHNPYALTGRTPFMLVNRISSMLNLSGPSEPIDTACSSSLVAVHKAAQAIQSGACKMAIAGGVNVILNPSVHLAFSAAGMLTDSGTCKVFDKEASGTIRSEGVGAILLKKLSDAIADNDHIYAVIRGSAEKHKGKSASLTAPNSNAEANLLVEVYEKANIDPTTVTYIETHSTGTRLGDPIEINGLKTAFETLYQKNHITEVQPHCAISSLKTNIGHLEAAAGIGAMIKVLLSMKHETLLSTLHFKELNPYISLENSPFYINTQIKPWERIAENIPRRAGISAFGFGGVNVHVLLEEYINKTQTTAEESRSSVEPAMIVLSAKNEECLTLQAQNLWKTLQQLQYQDKDLEAMAYTLQTGREGMTERLALTAVTIKELQEKLTEYLQNPASKEVYLGSANHKSELVEWLLEEEGIQAMIDVWISKREYDKLLKLWVKGGTVNWKSLYHDKTPKRLTLPTYPFEKQRYWIVNQEETSMSTKEESKVPDRKEKNLLQRKATNSEEEILKLLSALLSVSAASIDKNQTVEDLGIDSMILTQLLQQLQVINPAIDFEALYLCKTVQEIMNMACQDIQTEEKEEPKETEFPEIVRLNGSYQNRPVFWFHGGFGGIEVYRYIAKGIQRPFYGIQARGYMNDLEPIEGIEAMASYYVRMLQSVQPEGPYDLGGLSLGGMIAYEVARQLQKQGQKVNSLVMLESIYVDEMMKNDWIAMPEANLRKDRMFRSVNLILAFSAKEELVMIADSEINQELSDEAFLEQLILLAKQKGAAKSDEQLRKSILQMEKILGSLDKSTALYQAMPMPEPEEVPCYYICNTSSSLFGEKESYFRLVDQEREYNYHEFCMKWKEKLPNTQVLEVEATSHLTLLTEPGSQKSISEFCQKLYV